ncbi:MAG: hypothetical protein U5N85_08415 [Arcicella sp.]|nr:hypothetical protein [Arcicella sp.]
MAELRASSRIAGAETSEKMDMYAYPNPSDSDKDVQIQYYVPKTGKVSLTVTNNDWFEYCYCWWIIKKFRQETILLHFQGMDYRLGRIFIP